MKRMKLYECTERVILCQLYVNYMYQVSKKESLGATLRNYKYAFYIQWTLHCSLQRQLIATTQNTKYVKIHRSRILLSDMQNYSQRPKA